MKKIEVHNNDKYDGNYHVKADIYFIAVEMLAIHDEKEISEIISEI